MIGIFEEAHVFEQVMGLPAHPLLLHAAVVFIPLLAIGSTAYAVVPALRPRIWWLVGLLAIAGAGSAYLTHESGNAFRARLIRNGRASGDVLTKIAQHKSYGDVLMWVAIALGAVTLALVFVAPGWRRPARPADLAPARHDAGRVAAERTADRASAPGDAEALPAKPGNPGGPAPLGTAVERSPAAPALRIVLAVAAIGLSVASLYYVFKTGDSGARIVWSGS